MEIFSSWIFWSAISNRAFRAARWNPFGHSSAIDCGQSLLGDLATTRCHPAHRIFAHPPPRHPATPLQVTHFLCSHFALHESFPFLILPCLPDSMFMANLKLKCNKSANCFCRPTYSKARVWECFYISDRTGFVKYTEMMKTALVVNLWCLIWR